MVKKISFKPLRAGSLVIVLFLSCLVCCSFFDMSKSNIRLTRFVSNDKKTFGFLFCFVFSPIDETIFYLSCVKYKKRRIDLPDFSPSKLC